MPSEELLALQGLFSQCSGMRFGTERAIFLGLAALYDIAERATAAPVDSSLDLRAILAGLHALSNGDREPFDAFWHEVRQQHAAAHSESVAGYQRASYARMQWEGIARACGVVADTTYMAKIAQARGDARGQVVAIFKQVAAADKALREEG